MTSLTINSYVVANKPLKGEINKNSVGLIKALNGVSAIVLFVGKNLELKVDFQDLDIINLEHTGKGYPNKICNICHILKETEEFDINQTDAKGNKTTRPSCRECRKDIDGHSLTTSEKKRMDAVKPPKFSIFQCPICEKRTIVGITANLVRDHDHDTGNGREWICDSCNTGLGRFKDDVKFLQKVIDYLNSFK